MTKTRSQAQSPDLKVRPTYLLAAVLAVVAVATLGAQQAPDRSKPPMPGPPPALKLPPIQKRALSNGLPVWVVEMHEVPVVNIALVVRAGASADPAGGYGIAAITADMLDEGAGSRNALDLSDAIVGLGASLSTSSGYDASTVRLQVPVARLDAALPLMADVVLRPTFSTEELERVRRTRLTSLLQSRDNPAALASIAYSRVLYGPRHRYGTGVSGTEATVKEISIADLKSFHTTYYRPDSAHLIVVGDVTAADVLPKLESAFGAWRATGAAPKPPAVPAASQHASRQIYLIDKPGAAQSQIRIGWIGVGRRTPDYYVLDVLNTILGGSFSSRLNMNLREEHGYSYGASSFFDMRLEAGPFTAAAGVQTDKTVESLREFFKELDGIRQPVPGDELMRAKNLEALGFPAAFETTSGMAGNVSELVIYGLPESFFTDYVPKIQAVTSPDVQRAANQYVQPDKFAVVVVGDLSKIEKPIRDANLAPVKVISVEEIVK
jgi:predicted Zn-dependent peptidase